MEALSPTYMTEIPEDRNGSLSLINFTGDLSFSLLVKKKRTK